MKVVLVRKKTLKRRRLMKVVGGALAAFAVVHSMPDLIRELKLYRM